MELSLEQLAELFKGLAHPTRLQILDLLREGEMCVCHIEATLSKRQAYVSQQLMTLREVGLVDSRRDGMQVYYRLTNSQIADLLNLMLGTTRQTGIQCVEGCPCPSCSVISLSEIQ
ncbi:MAG: metalloregulator ArsR/SmtB family transcription factor [Chloroflexota bacterium]